MLSLITTPFALLGALVRVLGTPRYRQCVVVPVLVGAVTFAASFYHFWINIDQLALYIPRIELSWLPKFLIEGFYAAGNFFAVLLSILLCSAAATLSALIATTLLASFLYETLVERVLSDRGLLPSNRSGATSTLMALMRGLLEDIKKGFFIGIFLAMLFVAGFIPLAAPFVLLFGAYLVGFDIVDLLLKLSGRKFRERWRMAKRNWTEVLSLGVWFSLLLFVPLATTTLLPAGYVLAIERVVSNNKNLKKGG